MNTNKKKKIVEVKNIKTIKTDTIKVKFKSNTTISGALFIKDKEYKIDKSLLGLIKNFIY